MGGSGTTTAGLMYGGSVPGAVATTESYDGTSWTEIADMATARYGAGAAGVTTGSAIAACGSEPARSDSTEEYADPVYSVKTVTVS